MKKTIIYFMSIAVVALLGLTSCSNVLDTDPLNEPSEKDFWKSQKDFNSALTGCYQSMQGDFISYVMPAFDCLTDNAYGAPSSGYHYNALMIQQDNFDPSTTGLIDGVYKNCYSAIETTNIFLDHLAAYDGPDIANYRDQYEGEALFLRSYSYYLLWLFYGEVPYVDHTVNIENQDQPKMANEELYQHIMADIDLAIEKLADNTYMTTGRATKGAARALKARMLMYHAYGTDGKIAHMDDVQNAYDLIGQIQGYSLDSDYPSVFISNQQSKSQEIIFSVKFLAPDSYNLMDFRYGNYGCFYPVSNLTDMYEPNDVRLTEGVAMGDPGSTIMHQWKGGDLVQIGTSITGKRMLKWLTPYYVASDYWSGSTRSDVDIVYLRWGEMLLLRAEAANELGHTAEAEQWVNQIRQRAQVENCPANMTQDEMRQYIRDERRRETPFELIRYYDMRRWHIMNKLEGLVLDPTISDAVCHWQSAHEYWPIPQSQIDVSNGVLLQNPNY